MNASLLTTMVERLGVAPRRPLYSFLDRHGKEVDSADCEEIVRRAAGTADFLRAAGVGPGDPVLLIFPPDGLEFVASFFGCMLVGAIAVPVASPDPRYLDRELPKLRHVVEDSGARVALTHAKYRALTRLASVANRMRGRGDSGWPELSWLLSNRIRRAEATVAAAALARAASSFGPDDVVYLQYTSGSTSTPKGVVVRHRNLVHNLELIARNTRVDDTSVLVGWVPLFHDMGLAGGILNAMYTGARCIAFSPLTFLAAPRLWLEAIDRYRGTHIAGPNFGYDYVLRGADKDDESLDLSSLRATLQGGEPMLPATMDRVEAELTRMRFDPASFCNVYGMAEAVLFVCGQVGRKPTLLRADRAVLDRHGTIVPPAPHAPVVTLVGSGVPDAELGVSVIAVDPVTRRPRPPGAVGELWVSSPSVSSGYWGRSDEENAAVFAARPATRDNDGRRFLRTGDLGIVSDDGEVFICGRLKDLIIVGGRNIHPQDLEAAVVAADPILRPGNAIAFGVQVDGVERVVVAAEVRRKHLDSRRPVPLDRAASAIRAAVAAHCGVQCHEVLLMKPDSLPKTTSGKLRRGECKQRWTDGSLRSSALSGRQRSPATVESIVDTEQDAEQSAEYVLRLLQTEVAAMLHSTGPNDVPVDLPLRDLGFDSLGLMDLARRIENRIGARVPPEIVGDGLTLRAVATEVVRRFARAPSEQGEAASPVTSESDVPFSAGQTVALQRGQWDWWNRAVMLDVRRRLTPEQLRRATTALVARHEALRLRFRRADDRFIQRYGDIEGSFAVESVTMRGSDALLPLLNEQHRRLSVENGPVLRLLLVETGTGTNTGQRLFITVNHLVMDGVTLGILVDDLDRLCRSEEHGLPPASARFEEFSRWMNDFGNADATADLDFWREQLAVPPPTAYDSRAHPGALMKDLAFARQHLGPDETRALRTVRTGGSGGSGGPRAPIATTLLAALLRTAQRRWRCGRLVIELFSSGRQTAVHGLDLSRTVGDMHCTFPLAFEDSAAQSPEETMTAVAERLTRVPSAGMSFDALTLLADDPGVRNRILDAPAPTLGFNFQGEAPTQSAGGLFALHESPLGDLWDPEGSVRQPPLYLECSVVAGTTRIGWEYLPRLLNWSGAEIDEWKATFADELAGLVRRATHR